VSKRGLLIIISGPSGAGKGTLRKKLLSSLPSLQYSVSVATRPPRIGEKEGVNYFFRNKDEFKQMIRQGKFLEWAKVYGDYYGTPLDFVEKNLRAGKEIILEVDVQGALKIKKNLSKLKGGEAIFIFVTPSRKSTLYQRLLARKTESKEAIKKRMESAREELHFIDEYDYLIFNDQLSEALSELKAIIKAERCRQRIAHEHEKVHSPQSIVHRGQKGRRARKSPQSIVHSP